MSNEEFAQKYCLTEICNDEQISYLKKGCASLVSAIGDRNASNVYAHQRAAKKYPYFSAVTQELFDCADFYAPAIENINKKIAAEGVDFKFEQLHPAIQFASFRILALGQEGYAPKIGKSIANCIKKDPNAIDYITAEKINQQVKDGLLKDILKPRPKVIDIIDSVETKPIEYWMGSEHLYNAANGGFSDISWFTLRKREILSNERIALLKKEMEDKLNICEPVSLTINNIPIDPHISLRDEIILKKQEMNNQTMAENISFTLNGEEGIKNSTVYDETGKKLTGRMAKKYLKQAKEKAELAKNPEYWNAIQQAMIDRAKNRRA